MRLRKLIGTVLGLALLCSSFTVPTPAQAKPLTQELLQDIQPYLFQFVEPWQLLIVPSTLPKQSVPPVPGIRFAPPEPKAITTWGGKYLTFPGLPWRAEAVVNIALAKQGVPYVYGANPNQTYLTSADCSSFLVYIFRQIGIFLPRVSWSQLSIGRDITFDKALPGDILGFYGAGGAGGHVGLYIGNGFFIHAPQSGDVIRVARVADGPALWKVVRVIPELDRVPL